MIGRDQDDIYGIFGFYFGEPNDDDTREYMHSMTAEFED